MDADSGQTHALHSETARRFYAVGRRRLAGDTAFSHNQFAGEYRVLHVTAADDAEDGFDKYSSGLVNILTHGRQRWTAVGGKADVVNHIESDDLSSRRALVGKHRVAISTYREVTIDATGKEVAAVKEILPANYNAKTELDTEVNSGSNVIDWALIPATEEDEIIQPDE